MPNLDVLRVALIVLLVASLVGAAAWFVSEVAPEIVETGLQARMSLEMNAAPAWGAVVRLFGISWPVVWRMALALVLLLGTVFFVLRLVKWVQ